MHARTACLAIALSLVPALGRAVASAQGADITARAAVAANGDAVQLLMTSGGKSPGLSLTVGKGKPEKLFKGESIGTVKAAHDKIVVAYGVDDPKASFRIHVVGGENFTMKRPTKRPDVPYAVVMAVTPDGFMVLFQDIEASNTNEAHTYMVELDKTGKPAAEPREVQIPWALGDAAWNGSGYHLALFYAGGDGVRLSMVTMTKAGVPQGHPDWASKSGLVSDVHLVTDGDTIRAFYRGGMGDRLLEADVTKIRNWGNEPPKAKDHGALGGTQAIAVNAKGQPTKLSRR
jgi:hypothetical protein